MFVLLTTARNSFKRTPLLTGGVKGQFVCLLRGTMAERKGFWSDKTGGTTYEAEKKKYLEMPLEEKRKAYKCGLDFIVLDKIKSWFDEVRSEKKGPIGDGKLLGLQISSVDANGSACKSSSVLETISSPENGSNTRNVLASKVSLLKRDITSLEVDAIVNAANTSLLGGNGVDGSIHRAAGKSLYKECETLGGCKTGMAKITSGYRLPSKFVIHTVGPRVRGETPSGEEKRKLESCYEESLKLVKENKIKSVAFPCISTGVYHYPPADAAEVALSKVKDWLNEKENSRHNFDLVDRVIFCVFLAEDLKIYKRLMPKYFPVDE